MSTKLPRVSAFWRSACTALALLSFGCLELQHGEPVADKSCTACHGDGRRAGDQVRKAAPPLDLNGKSDVTQPGVGAHERHLFGDGHQAVACIECHVVPKKVFDPGHVDSKGPAEVTFGLLAATPASSALPPSQPAYDASKGNCTDTYCHRDASVQWTQQRTAKDACGTCHGLPPPLPHPQKTECFNCHSDVIGPNNKWIAPERHVDGIVDVKLQGKCASCHGINPDTGGPPPDLSGNVAPSAIGVGAHANHLNGSSTHAPVACNECHKVPTEVESEGHIDADGIADVTFGTLAQTKEHKPAYLRDQGNCTNTYCHGDQSGQWQQPRDSEQACGSCHALPPPAPHFQSKECSRCHGRVVGPDQKIKEPSLHINGTVEVDFGNGCSTCHGTGEDGRPPPDLKGNTDPAARGVGAHAVHLAASATHGAVACSACHHVPVEIEDPLHIDGSGIARVTFGPAASALGYHPSYDPSNLACSGTYCHRAATPNWTAPRSSEDACGSCHALPPPQPHPARVQCSICHSTVIDAAGNFIAPELHVNGKIDLGPLPCNGCHGTDVTGAPPEDTFGNTSTSARGVGAHAQHLNAGPTHGAIACATCHHVPTTVDDPLHINGTGIARVMLTGAAAQQGYQPSYDSIGLSCSGTYCHRDAHPNWTAPRNSEDACGSCHELPPPAPHPARTDCSQCHAAVVDAARNFVAPELHVNGQIDLSPMPCNGCHGTDPNGAPPPDLAGNTSTSARGVGAHAWHLQATATHAAVACAECHNVPADVDAPGHRDTPLPAEVTFANSVLGKANGSAPKYSATDFTCSGSYCHGAAIADWTAPRNSQDACGSCHGLPPPAPHPQKADCSTCHSAVIDATRTFVAPERHVNGQVDVSPLQCNSCHGTDPSGAPPPDNAGNTLPNSRGVGAHAWHLQATPTHAAIACNECHNVPASVDAPGHRDTALPAEVTFANSTLAKANGAKPSYSATQLTCSGSYCHGTATPNWTAPRSSTDACGKCHALPPPFPHPQKANCSECHGAVIDAAGEFVAPERHVNGQVELGTLQCNFCHGTDSSGAPPPDTSGNTDPSARGVGAHAWHVQGSATHGPVMCQQCHIVPSAFDSPGHADTPLPAEVTFGSLAQLNGSKPTYVAAATTCSGTYCHGSATPDWTTPRSDADACGSCHGLPPPAPHPSNTQCVLCHGAVVDAQRAFVAPTLHVDGQVQVVQNCTACHGSATNAAPPVDTSGSSDPTRISIGAHQIHLSGGKFGRPLECRECHLVPSSIEATGHLDVGLATPADVSLTGPAAANGRNPQWDRSTTTCSGSWCHGPLDPTNQSPSWIAPTGNLTCVSCHAMPPAAPHPANNRCDTCHNDVDSQNRITDRGLHVNGDVDLN